MTIITLKVDGRSEEILRRYIEENGFEGKNEFHSTLIYTEEVPIFRRGRLEIELKGRLPLELDSSTYSFDIFGSGNLVLKYENEEIESMRRLLRLEAIRQSMVEWPDLEEDEFDILRSHVLFRRSKVYDMVPHITLAKSCDGNLEDLPDFTASLTFSDFNWYHQQITA
ncbi:MAG: hypothetical protein Q8Q35_02115 [Nanoarchaeota archaeon]|nr:hypothetical protein [Nanoarchaeota archaeon]